jgi:hypothetical protein
LNSATASCEEGETVVGGGFRSDPAAAGWLIMVASAPTGASAWTVEWVHDVGGPAFAMNVYAICQGA